jgi:hypothetical protein
VSYYGYWKVDQRPVGKDEDVIPAMFAYIGGQNLALIKLKKKPFLFAVKILLSGILRINKLWQS